MKTLRPTGSNVLVKLVDPNPESLSIQIPDEFKQPSQCGVVVAAGPGSEQSPMIVKTDDKVILPKIGGTDLEYDGVKYRLLRQDEILTLVEA